MVYNLKKESTLVCVSLGTPTPSFFSILPLYYNPANGSVAGPASRCVPTMGITGASAVRPSNALAVDVAPSATAVVVLPLRALAAAGAAPKGVSPKASTA